MRYFDLAWKVQCEYNSKGIPAVFSSGEDGYTVIVFNLDGNRTIFKYPIGIDSKQEA